MTDNRITAGEPEEPALLRKQVNGVRITRRPEDPIALRVSIGAPLVGSFEAQRQSYLVFRGDPQDVLRLLERSVTAMRKIC